MALTEYKIKVVDASNKPLLNFPMATRYVGGDKKNNKLTSDTEGILTFQSDGRAVEVFVLAPIDKNGQPDMTKFKEDSDNDNAYYQITTLNVLRELPSIIKSPYFLTDYGIAKTKFIFYENEQDKKVYSLPLTVKVSYLVGEAKNSPQFIEVTREVKNGELNITSILHSRIQVHPFKPDNTPFKTPQGYTPRSTTPITLSVYFDIKSNNSTTEPDEPDLSVKVPEVGDIKCLTCGKSLKIDLDFIIKVAPKAKKDFQQALLNLPKFLKKYSSNTCKDLVHILAQGKIETEEFKALIESMIYTTRSYTGKSLYNMMKTNFTNAFKRHGMEKLTLEQRYKYVEKHFLSNDPAIAQFLYSVPEYPNKNYRGRGLIHLTHFATYVRCAKETGLDIEKNPELLQTDYNAAIESATWFWKDNNINNITKKDNSKINDEILTNKVTVVVNPGMKKAKERREEKLKIATEFIAKYGECK
ncbi:glycoside hydrolase family 19 protein [Acinetobacter sp.]|jgi:predicted chitinase|uniref:glycoside hydrolase family 19 protein n=1 Tax=Acinetobacter sp. TaxID=472 RepID=UPI00282EE648|nr:glycoside hydrolase family 19 protein [Acinetobacter sp.]MDR2249667.1 hypothetical protein [Acinetobacter sp.]